MGVTEEVGKVGAAAVSAMQSQPLAIALLVINCMFLGLTAYVLSAVAANAGERNKQQMELIANLFVQVKNCGQLAPRPNSILRLPPIGTEIPIRFEAIR